MIFDANQCYNLHMKNNQKGSITIIALVIILVIAAVGLYMNSQNNSQVTTGAPVSAQSEMYDEDADFGFE